MKVGIFGGSFDPVHNEHVAMAQAAVFSLGLDKLIVVPAFLPPHKKGKTLAAAEDRLHLCSLAFAAVKGAEVEISDYEIAGGGTSYSYITCRHFKECYPQAELFFLAGRDMLEDFYTWRYPEKILENVTLAVCRRNDKAETLLSQRGRFFDAFHTSFREIDYNGGDVSSTRVRCLARIGEDISSLVPAAVARYIGEKQLYLIPFAGQALSLEKPKRAAHSRRVALFAGEHAAAFHVDEYKAVLAGVLHDVGKNLKEDSPYLVGFVPPEGVPAPVLHQYSGAFVAEHTFGVSDEDVLNAIRYHTSGRRGMSDLEKLIYLADMLEPGRDFKGVDRLRKTLSKGLDECMYECLKHQSDYLEDGDIYPLTTEAYEEMKEIKGVR